MTGVRRIAILEIVLFLGVSLVLDWVFFGANRFWNVSPHPFWMIVILVSAQYGTREGLLAAMLASVALLAGNLPPRTFSQDMYDYLFLVTQQPLMWSIAAVLLGELRQRQINERQRLQTELETSRRREDDLAAHNRKLEVLSELLETRLAGQTRTPITTYRAARALDGHSPSEVLNGVREVMRAMMNPQKFSLFVLKENSLRILFDEGWSSRDEFPREYGADAALFRELIRRKRVISCADENDALLFDSHGVLAGPIVTEAGKMIGMLKVERLGFLGLTTTSFQTFQVVCEWIGHAYAKSVAHERWQMNFLSALAGRMDFKMSMIRLRLENHDRLSAEQTQSIGAALRETIQISARTTDLVLDEFSIVLPLASVQEASIVAERILRVLNNRIEAAQARFSYTVQPIERIPERQAS